MAYTLPTVWYCDSAQWTAVAAWTLSHAYAAGALVRQNATPTVGNERVFACIVAGTSNSTEPTWVVTKGAKTTDNTVTWIEVTGQPSVNGDTTNSVGWRNSSTPALGFTIYDPTSGSIQVCTTSGAGGSSTPTFSATAGVTTTDASATWTSLGAASNFVQWKAPFARLQSAWTANWVAGGNIVFLGDDHAETQAAAMTCATTANTAQNPSPVYCVDHTASVPPGSANLKTTATISTTGANALTLTGSFVFNGVTFSCGTSGAPALGVVNSLAQGYARFDNCNLQLGSGVAAGSIQFGDGARQQNIVLNNTTITFSAVSQTLVAQAVLTWRNTASALLGTIPTSELFNTPTGALVTLEGVDLSALVSGALVATSTSQLPSRFTFINCKLNLSLNIMTAVAGDYVVIDIILSDSSGTTYQQLRYGMQATLSPSTTIVRTGGASDGTTPISWSIATNTFANWYLPFEAFPISIWNSTLSTNRGVTLYGIWNSASLPNNDQIWVDVEYLGSASSPLASLQTGTKANGLATGTALTADSSSTWSSAATARVNSHAYIAGNVISVSGASGGGGIFFCTVAGTSSTSQPGGYATAVDGGTVTDGGATFRAGMRFTLSVTLSSPQPALAGYIRATIKAALASSTFYVDPLINLS